MTSPLVSICISTYNHERYIARCLESVVAQLPPGEIEVLVGDDGSTDGTREIIATYARTWHGIVTPILNEKNLGPSGNLSNLIALTKGRYIAHLDGDDYWLPGKLIEQLAILNRNPLMPAVACNALVISDDGNPLGFFTDYRKKDIGLDDLVGRGNFLCHGSILYRAAYKARLLEVPVPYIDYMLLIRLAMAGKIGYLRSPFVAYRWNSSTSMRTAMRGLVHENFWQALKYAAAGGVCRAAQQAAVTRFFEQVLVANLMHGKIDTAWSWAQRLHKESTVPVTHALLLGVLRVPLSLWRYLRKRHDSRRFMRASVFYRR